MLQLLAYILAKTEMIMGNIQTDVIANKNSTLTKRASAKPPGAHTVSVGKQQICDMTFLFSVRNGDEEQD